MFEVPSAAAVTHGAGEPQPVEVRLEYREPCDVAGTLRFLGRRAVPGVESSEPAPGGPAFVRALDLPHAPAVVRLSGAPAGAGYARAAFSSVDPRDLPAAVACCRGLLDLDTDPAPVAAVLGAGPLAGHVAARPGLRVPGAADGGELAIRAVLGQQISVAGARTLAGRLAARFGRPLSVPGAEVSRTFPRPGDLAAADPAELPMPASRARALVELCAALDSGEVVLDGSAERADVERALLARRGIGPWTAGYIRMRALRDPDVWLGTDLEVVKALGRLSARSRRGRIDPAQWSPWRSYAVLQLWSGDPHER